MEKILRHLVLLIALAGAALLPVAGHLAVQSWQRYQGASERLEQAHQRQTVLRDYWTRAESYDAFAKQAETFTRQARDAHVEPDQWLRYEVAIQQDMVSVSELQTTLDNARHGSNYYFQPRRMEVLSLFSPEFTTKEARDKLPAGPLKELFTRMDKEKQPLEPGRKVILTLEGTYHVLKTL